MAPSSSFFKYLLFLFLFSRLAVRYSASTQQPLCNDEESSYLLQFKESLVAEKFACLSSANYSKVSSWNLQEEKGDCCSWGGIDCDNNTGHVIGLDLSGSCLYGSINSSSSLFRLLHLTSLNLAYNNFNFSKIPPQIKNLSRLTYLNLSSSHLSGQIPSETLELSDLVSLDLSDNPLILQTPSLKDLVETLTHLTRLYLSGVLISSTVPDSLTKLSNLSALLLRDCELQGEFPAGIFQLPNLRFLILRWNPNLTGYLPEFQEGNPLELLRLENTSFSGHIPDSIDNLKSLNYFVVSRCRFSGPIPSSIGKLTKMDILDLSYNNLSGQIPSSLGNLLRISFLSLSFNKFSPSNLNWICNLTKLTNLWLSSNNLVGQLPSCLGNLPHLTALVLAGNKLQGPIPKSIFKLPDLQVLDLEINQLNGSLSFDLFLKSTTNLVDLKLSKNSLSVISSTVANITSFPKFKSLGLGSCNLTEFPLFLRGQNDLGFLDLSDNKIHGLIPNWISELATESLWVLNLDSNFLTGFEQPLTFLPWTNLLVLNFTYNNLQGSLPIPPPSIFIYSVSDNRFTGEISPVFCNLTSVLTLDVSNNSLNGSVPQCLGNFVSVLDLHKNNFSGNIPDAFTSDCALRMIDFSQNKLEGKIPRSLANCSKLESLHLGNNQIIDFFPSWLGILQELRILILRSNGLLGVFGKPETKRHFPHLKIIDLSYNNFTGKFPLEYSKNWVAMKSVDQEQLKYMEANISFQARGVLWTDYFSYSITIRNKGLELAYRRVPEFFSAIDLSSNRLEGEIPEEIGNLKGLQLLNLSNNILSGQIPTSLGNLNELEALDLSMNRLSGEMPDQLTQITFLAFLNVSDNNLTGRIPRGRQFETFENNSFAGNSGLCGAPLSKKCVDDGGSPIAPTGYDEESGTGSSSFELSWKAVLIGCGSGVFIGIVMGCRVDIRNYGWLIKKIARLLQLFP